MKQYAQIHTPTASGANTLLNQQPYDGKAAFATYITEQPRADKAFPK
jgi:hypothetical protein